MRSCTPRTPAAGASMNSEASIAVGCLSQPSGRSGCAGARWVGVLGTWCAGCSCLQG